jgi:hypothetical protein
MKKYIYKVVFQDDTERMQTWTDPVMLSNTQENTHEEIKSLTFVECIDVDLSSENQEIVVEADEKV